MAVFNLWMIKKSRRNAKREEFVRNYSKDTKSKKYCFIGYRWFIVFGADWLVKGAKNIARSFETGE